MNVAAVGPRELLSGLQAFGVTIFHATDTEEALAAIDTIRSHHDTTPYGVVFITERMVSGMTEEEYEHILGEHLPVVLTIPDLSSQPDAGLEKLRALTKRAVGSDIFNEQP